MDIEKPALFQIDPRHLVGSWRRFGPVGPVYEIIGAAHSDNAGTPCMRIRVLESGEEVDYRLTDLLEDPKER
jgi:hypothetical protein